MIVAATRKRAITGSSEKLLANVLSASASMRTRPAWRMYGDSNRGDAAEQCQRQAFRHELPDQPAATGTERQSQHHLGSPRRAAREEQVREVGAGDEQQDTDGGHECRQGRRELPALVRRRRDRRAESADVDRGTPACGCPTQPRRRTIPDRIAGPVGLRLGLSGRDAWRQPREDVEPHRLVRRRLAQPVVAGNHARLQCAAVSRNQVAGRCVSPTKPGAATPMIVSTACRIVRVSPSTSSRPPNRRCQ